MPSLVTLLVALLALHPTYVSGVKRNDFKTCAQSGFCRRLRDLPPSTGSSPYHVDPATAGFDPSSGLFTAELASQIWPEARFSLTLGVTAAPNAGLPRLKIDELNGVRQRYNETARWALQSEPGYATAAEGVAFAQGAGGTDATLSWSYTSSGGSHAKHQQQARVTFSPFKVEFLRDGEVHVSFNEQNLFHMEHFRIKEIGGGAADGSQEQPEGAVDTALQQARATFEPFMSDDGAWEETFNGHKDSKPKGPEAYSFDVTFPNYEHVFGIPEHASPLSLRTTRGGDNAFTDPYRLWNLDVFEYEANSEMALYGAIPFMHAHRPGSTVALFSLTASENWIDITKSSKSTQTHWMAESGVLDLIIFLGPTNSDIFEKYGKLTGMTALPQMFAIGHHQCRWNYLNQEDVQTVSEKFDEYDIPMDVLWLDIEYAEEHKYFIWDRANFPEPEKMQDKLAEVGRQLVAIVDPHIKRVPSLYVYKEAQDLDILYKRADGSEFEGWCWTGSSSWTDYFNPKSFDWWISLFKFDKFVGSRRNLFVWNDMNEPSVFNGPEITAPKDVVHHGGWEHRDVHNINGMVYHNLTAQALIEREDKPRRPFVLSRSFFAGSQRYGAIWTGDNLGTWEHLAVAVPMVLSNSIAGMSFNGADVGGFFGNPSNEMMVRWYQNGAFHPFFRAHAHIDTKRREPYLFDDPIRSYMRDAIRLRYSLLPAWYTAFFHASLSGTPVVRPHYVAFPNDAAGFAVDDQFFVGDSGLLVRPVVEEGATTASVYLADDEPYYNYFDNTVWTRASSSASRSRVTVPGELSRLPLFHHGGSILTRRDIIRRSAPLMWRDPITLVIALDKSGAKAHGDIYLDDGDSYDFQQGEMVWRSFDLSGTAKKSLVLSSTDAAKAYRGGNDEFRAIAQTYNADNAFAQQKIAPVNVEEIVVLGLGSKPTCVREAGQAHGLHFEWTDGVASNAGFKKNGQAASRLVVRSAGLPIIRDWQLHLEFEEAKACRDQSVVAGVTHSLAQLEDPTCPRAGMARCQNKGHISACVLVSRINDGICDPECCDGSDETDGKVQCPNRCAAVNKEYRAKIDEEARIQRVGSKIRKDWSAAGLKEKRKIEKSIAKIEAELVGLREKESGLKVILDKVERSEAGEIERKRKSKLFKRVEEYQSSLASLRKHREYLQEQVGSLQALMADLKKSFNPNYQDMAVLGAVRAFDDWSRKNGYPVAEGGPDRDNDQAATAAGESKDEVQPVEVDFDDLGDDYLRTFEGEDILGLMAELDAGPGQDTANLLFRIEEYLPDSLRPKYDSLRVQLLDLLANYGVISHRAVEQADRPDIAKARANHQEASSAVADKESAILRERSALEKDWGVDWEWKKLEGQCVDKEAGEYTYSLCWFDKVVQKSNRGHSTTTLGKFASWHPNAEQGSLESYSGQIYDKGQRCWNGPDRSAHVELVCGTSNAILSVAEPEKCTYLFKVQTPAVCYEAAEAADTPGSSQAAKPEL